MSIYDPTPSIRSTPYWEGIDADELRYQECEASCGHRWMVARDACPRCGAAAAWRAASGAGTVYSYSVVHRAPTKELKDRVPYVLALVDLEEGPRMMTWVTDVEPGDVRIGLPVQVHFAVGPGTRKLPLFRPSGAG